MKITDLSSDELKTFLTGLTDHEILRSVFYNERFARKIHGFRIKAVPEDMLVRTSMDLVEKEKDFRFINALENVVKGLNQMAEERRDNNVAKGMDDETAFSEALASFMKPDFEKVFLKLIDKGEEADKYLHKHDEHEALNQQMTSLISESTKEIPDIKKLAKGNESEIKKLSDKIADLSNAINKINKEIKASNNKKEQHFTTDEEFEKLQREFEAQKSYYDKRIRNLEKSLSDLKKSNDQLVKTIAEQKQLFSQLANAKDKLSKYGGQIFCQNIVNKQYEPDTEDDLDFAIGDVTDGLLKDAEQKAFSAFLKDCLYSRRPILTVKNNEIILARIMSGILTGGNFSVLNCDSGVNVSDILYEIKEERLDGSKESVVVINGFLGKVDLSVMIQQLSSLSNIHFILGIPDDRFVKFLPEDFLASVTFFKASFVKDVPSENYFISLSQIQMNRAELLTDLLKKNGIDSSVYTFSDDYSGMLVFSILPLAALYSGKDVEDIADESNDSEIKQISESYFHE